jgi:hypothetical protein
MKPALTVAELAPLEYRIALDAACAWLATHFPQHVCCEQAELAAELDLRLSPSLQPPWLSALWLEPQQEGWQAGLPELSSALPAQAHLAVLLSLPPARRLPERRHWRSDALGEQPGGLKRFLQALAGSGFILQSLHGLHSGQSALLNSLALLARRGGRLAWGDRLEFAARKSYIKPLSQSWGATVALALAVCR